jgi:hypothetical protein
MAFKMRGFSGFHKNGPDDGPHPDRKTNVSVEVDSVMPDGGGLMVRGVPGMPGVVKVAGGAQGIAEIQSGQTVKVNVGAGGKVTLASSPGEDFDRTGGPRPKNKRPGPTA